MKKLTLVSLACRGYRIQAFCYLPIVNGSPYLSQENMDKLFLSFGIMPPFRGETITIGC